MREAISAVRRPVGCQQHDPSALRRPGHHCRRPRQRQQFLPILVPQRQRRNSHARLSRGTAIRIRDVVERVRHLVDPSITRGTAPGPERPHMRTRVADVDATTAALGWRPMTPLDRGSARTVKWYRRSPTYGQSRRCMKAGPADRVRSADLTPPHQPGIDVHIVERDLPPVHVEPAYDRHWDLLTLPNTL